MEAFTCTRHLPTCDGRATMDMRSNTPPDFTVKTDSDDLDLSAEQVVVAYHERTKHHYHRYAASLDTWIGLSSQIRSAVTTEPRWFAFLSPTRASASVLAALRCGLHGAGSAFGRLDLALLALCTLIDGLEAVRGNHMVSACQSVEREPPPDGGILALAVFGRYPRPSRRIPLCIEGARSRASSGL